MELTWSLDELYTDIDSPFLYNDLREFTAGLNELSAWIEDNLSDPSNAARKLEHYITSSIELAGFENLFIYTALSLAADMTNEKALKLSDKLDELAVIQENHLVILKNFLKAIPDSKASPRENSASGFFWDDLHKQSSLLSEHSFILNELRESALFMMTEAKEGIASSMKTTGSILWQKMWEQLTSTLMIDIDINGEQKKLTLSEVRNLYYESDGALRKYAYTKELESYKRIDKACAFALNGIKGEVLTLSRMRGYENPLIQTLQESRMDKKALDAMFSAINDSRPYFEAYFYKKAEILGHKNGLPFYDLFAPVGEMEISYTPESARDFILEAFFDFSEKMGLFAEQAFKNRTIDFMPREGKVGGAFCENLHNLKQSRILTNFSGSFDSVVTIAHELGHAYHNLCLSGQTILNSNCTMPIAETASTFSECILTQYALKKESDGQNALIVLENDIQGMAQTLIDIYSRFLFEDELFKRRINGSLSVNELNLIMTEAQKKAYGSGLDRSFIHPYMWCVKPHYYDADYNYYNFPYAFGSLLSKWLYSVYIKNRGEFTPLYDKMLEYSGRQDLYDTAKMCGFDIHDKAFWDGCISIVKTDIDKFIDMACLK